MFPVPVDLLGDVVLQSVTLPNGSEISVEFGLGSTATGSFLTTLLLGAILVALAPDYTERTMDAVRDDAVGSLVYGLVCLVGLVLLSFLLVISIFGILVAIPLILASIVVWAIGAAIAFLAIAERLVDSEDGWLLPLLVAATLNGGLALTGVGGIVSFAVGAAGFGAVLRDYLG